MKAVMLVALLGVMGGAMSAAAEEPIEPPPAAEDDGEWTTEIADTLAEGTLEVGMSTRGEGRRRGTASRRLRLRGRGLEGSARDRDDALGAGRVETPLAGGRARLGRLSPRWGQGLLLGGADEPWRAPFADSARGARGRPGDGASWSSLNGSEVFAGRFSDRRVGAFAGVLGPWRAGAVVAGGRGPQASLASFQGPARFELAGDRRGRWRAELAAGTSPGASAIGVRVRAGHEAFRSLADPARSGPARAATAAIESHWGATRWRAAVATWSHRPGVAGSRARLELDRRVAHHALFATGVEQQQGARRDEVTRPAGLRQGVWGELRVLGEGRAIALRHEAWSGEAAFRRRVREVWVARAEGRWPLDMRLSFEHAVWRAKRGEPVWLVESETDRLRLRAVSGAGQRTRIEWDAPAGEGRAKATLSLESDRSGVQPRWTLEWSKRSRW